MSDLSIPSLRGGLNDSEPPHLLQDDECTVALNVEWWFSSLGERRKGTSAFDITGSGLASESVIGFLTQWFPDNDIAHPEVWALGVTEGVSTTLTKRSSAGAWSTVVPEDPIDVDAPAVYGMNTQVLNAKQFFAYKSDMDRLHVWDGDTLRRTGIAQPDPPTVADEGSGSYSTTRYFRVRFVKRNVAGVVLVRSEPSESVSFSPSGSGAGARITRPSAPGDSEDAWEVEASIDDANFYHIAPAVGNVLAIGTTTYDDETDVQTDDYADLGPVSEIIGTYLLQPAAKFLIVDGDRLIGVGHWTDDAKKSMVWWSPVKNDPGAGNDERLPSEDDINNTVFLDTTDRGEPTGVSDSIDGVWYVFKWNQIYRFTRTYTLIRAYIEKPLTKTMGAIPGSIINAIDENGRSCVYFLDPSVGIGRIGMSGLQTHIGLRETWTRVNATATIAARAVYYPNHKQIWWWVATDGSDTPNLVIKLQLNEIASGVNGCRRGISLADGRMAEAYCAATINDLTLNLDGNQTIVARPFIGLTTPNCIQRCDLEDNDDGYAYSAAVRSKAFYAAGLLNKWGALTGALLATANEDATVKVSFIGDFGRVTTDTKSVTTTLLPTGTEPYVVKSFDDLNLSNATCIQVEFSDP